MGDSPWSVVGPNLSDGIHSSLSTPTTAGTPENFLAGTAQTKGGGAEGLDHTLLGFLCRGLRVDRCWWTVDCGSRCLDAVPRGIRLVWSSMLHGC